MKYTDYLVMLGFIRIIHTLIKSWNTSTNWHPVGRTFQNYNCCVKITKKKSLKESLWWHKEKKNNQTLFLGYESAYIFVAFRPLREKNNKTTRKTKTEGTKQNNLIILISFLSNIQHRKNSSTT